MKFAISTRLALMSMLLVISSNSMAYFIDGGATDVGAADAFLASTTLASSGEAIETAWVESVLGTSISLTSKTDFADLSSWSLATGTSSVFVHALASAPDYFLLKIGTGATGFDTHFLFSNAESFDYAVLDLVALGLDPATTTFEFFALSHLTEFSVPESSALLLLGISLLGLGLARRRS